MDKAIKTEECTEHVKARLRRWGLSDDIPACVCHMPDSLKLQYLNESIKWERLRRRTNGIPDPGCA